MRRAPVLVLVLVLGAGAPAALAHVVQVGVGTQTIVEEVSPRKVRVKYNAGYSNLTGIDEMMKADKNVDNVLQQAEIDAWMDLWGPKFVAGLTVELDGKRLELTLVKRKVEGLFAGHDIKTIGRYEFDTWWDLECPVEIGPGEHTIRIRERNFEGEIAQYIVWLFPAKHHRQFSFQPANPRAQQLRNGAGFQIYDSDVTVTVEFSKAALEPGTAGGDGGAAAETASPSSSPSEPEKFARDAARAIGRADLAGSEESEEEQKLTAAGQELARGASPWKWVVLLSLAFLWGAGHALMPGHGKSMVAAYLLGTQGRVRDAFSLGAIVTLTHTGSIFILGIAIFYLAEKYWGVSAATARGHSLFWLEVASGALIFVVGCVLFALRLRGYLSGKDAHHHHHHGHGHHHHDHEHAHEHGHEHGHDDGHGHGHGHGKASLWAIGFSGGIAPCSAGIGLILISLWQGWMWYGLILLVAFSLGLGAVLVSIAVVMVTTKALLKVEAREGRLIRLLPVVSTLLLCAVGVYVVLDAFRKNPQLSPFGG